MKINTRKVEYNAVDKLVYMETYMSEKPNPMPETSDDFTDLKPGYDFEVGSYIYITTTATLYMANGDGTWTEQ